MNISIDTNPKAIMQLTAHDLRFTEDSEAVKDAIDLVEGEGGAGEPLHRE